MSAFKRDPNINRDFNKDFIKDFNMNYINSPWDPPQGPNPQGPSPGTPPGARETPKDPGAPPQGPYPQGPPRAPDFLNLIFNLFFWGARGPQGLIKMPPGARG